MLDQKSGKKWQWIASPSNWLRLIRPSKQSIVSFYAQDIYNQDFKSLDYRQEKFYIMGKYIFVWIPTKVPLDKTEEYICKQILNRNFLKALKKV